MTELEQVKGGWKFTGYKGKGGGSSSAPVEAPDSLHSVSYARIKLLISEGEIEGLANGLKSVYLDSTPLQNDNGTLNFNGVAFDFRTGTQDQDYIPGFPAAESTSSVGVELRADTPYVRSSTNTQLSAMRVTIGFQGLSKANTSNGDINGYSVSYAIDISTDGAPYVQVLSSAATGKTTGLYSRSHRINLPPATTGWTLRVRRTTPNADSSTISDTTAIQFITDIIDGKQRHPMWAVAGIQLDAAQFSSIPTVSFDCKGRRIRVPTNYDPELRIYSGVWDGTFKIAWTNNPAWIFYDLITHTRYGLGNNIPEAWVDRYSLYVIGQYCDQMVPDGKGGTEPRFTCNVYIQQQADAYKVLQDLATVFRGLVYWGSGSAVPVADMPKDIAYTYTNANVIDGTFTYSGSPRKARYTSALVSWNDPSDQYKQKVEAVENQAGILRYGVQEVEIGAFGCTSQGQANRIGKWALETSMREVRTVVFSVGLDGVRVTPGQIINVADTNLAGRRISGRLSSRTIQYVTVDGEIVYVNESLVSVETPDDAVPSLNALTLDSVPVDVSSGDFISVILPSGVLEKRVIATIVGKLVTVTEDFSEAPAADSIWLIETEELIAQTFRVLNVTERDGLIFDISALQYDIQKFDAIDLNTRIELPPVSVIPARVQEAPASITIEQFSVMSQGVSSTTARFTWDSVDGAVEYDVQWRRDNSDWVQMSRTGTTSIELPNAYSGDYLARVRAKNSGGITSSWTNSVLTPIDGVLSEPPVVTSLTTTSLLFGIKVDWSIPTGPNIIEKSEVWYSETNDRADAIKLGDFAYPQQTHTLMGLSAGQEFFFWVRLVDKNGTVGEWYPETVGVHGMASSSADDILEYLAGEITETQLATELLEQIESGGGASVELEALESELAAMYTIKTQLTTGDGRTYLAGIGVGVENNEGIIESQVLVAADRFAVINVDDDVVTTPFVIQDGQVFIDSAVIANASIGSAKFADWLESDTVGAGGLPVLRFNFRTGAFEQNDITGGGIRQRNKRIQIFDESGIERVRLGNLA